MSVSAYRPWASDEWHVPACSELDVCMGGNVLSNKTNILHTQSLRHIYVEGNYKSYTSINTSYTAPIHKHTQQYNNYVFSNKASTYYYYSIILLSFKSENTQ